MKVDLTATHVKVSITRAESYRWANRPGSSWPCSELKGKAVSAEYDSNGLCDLKINGRFQDCNGEELNALVADHLEAKVPVDHPATGPWVKVH